MPSVTTHHYFVDEAGDLTLFDRRRRLMLGQQGVSNTFIVGAALIDDPIGLAHRLAELRARLLADPLLAGAPSMNPDAGKTAATFHAAKDLPEVRVEVFRLLTQERVKVFAAFRRKTQLAEQLRDFKRQTGSRQPLSSVYDTLVERIFRHRLHLAGESRVVFARRGQSDESAALRSAIGAAQRKFVRRSRERPDRPTYVASAFPREVAGLQVVDYFLWALQRLIEREEARFFEAMRPHFGLIVDVDDTRSNRFGEHYSARNPLRLETMMPVIAARSE